MCNIIISGCRCFMGCFLYYVPTPTYDISKLVKHPIQAVLMNAMNDPDCGVYVHWGVKGSGKTAYATDLANKLKSNGRLVFFLDPSSLSHPIMSTMAIKKFCDLLPPRQRKFELNPLEPPPTTIIIDDFDISGEWEKHRDVIQTLAKQSRNLKRFNLLLLVTSPHCAKTLCNDWDWTSIRWTSELGVWEEEHVAELLAMFPQHLAKEDYTDRLQLCVRAGTPGFVVWSAKEKNMKSNAVKIRAEKTAKEWADGYAILESE